MRYDDYNTVHNFSNNPVELKTWVVRIDIVSQNNLKALTAIGVKARAVLDYESFDAYGTTQHFSKGGTAEFETTCPEQETMLHLLYGKDLILKMVEVMLPNSTRFCTLTRL